MAYKDKEKQKATAKAWYERNRERKAMANKAWCERNPEKIRICRERNRERKAARDKIYNQQNRERKAANYKAWYERNREWVVTYRKLNRERRAATGKAWRERNRDLEIEKSRRRRCRVRNASICLTANETQKILLLERTRQELQKETGGEYHIDHILPIVHGGIHHPMNLRILEGRENESKQDKLLPEAIDLAYEHFMLYHDRVSPERAWEFVHKLAEGLGISVDEIRIDDQQIKLSLPTKSTLEDLME
jgi:hypothetical protein